MKQSSMPVIDVYYHNLGGTPPPTGEPFDRAEVRNGSTPGGRVATIAGMTSRLPAFAIVAAALLQAAPAQAEEDFFEPRALGMGGAVRILGGDTSAVHLNAALMAQNQTYLSSVAYQLNVREKGHRFSVGASDGKTSPFAIGTKYTIHTSQPPFDPSLDVRWFAPGDLDLEDRRTTHRWDTGFAYGFFERRINVGVTTRVIRQNNTIRDSFTKFTMDAGVTFWPIPVLGFGISAQNFIPTTLGRFPARVSPGFAVKVGDILRVGLDAVFDFTSNDLVNYIDLHAGAEVTIVQFLSVRGGWYSDKKFVDHFATWGLGFTLNKLRIDWAMRIEVGDLEKRLREDKPDFDNRLMVNFGIELSF